MVLVQIYDRFFIGDIDGAVDTDKLRNLDIRAVVTCGALNVPWCSKQSNNCDEPVKLHTVGNDDSGIACSEFSHLVLNLFDCPNADLLSDLEFTTDFIDNFFTCHQGNLLVHCWAGHSRSAAVSVAYLMRRSKKSFSYCFEQIRQKYPQASPNEGFIKQLILWQGMNCTIKDGTSQYLRYKNLIRATGMVGFLNDIPSTPISTSTGGIDVDTPVKTNQSSWTIDQQKSVGFNHESVSTPMVYSCRMCRTFLFDDSLVIGCQGTNASAKKHFTQNRRRLEQASLCTSVFVEQLDWFRLPPDEDSGKLFCSNSTCRSKLGNFSWFGARCSCGNWQVPAFQIHRSKIDKLPGTATVNETIKHQASELPELDPIQ